MLRDKTQVSRVPVNIELGRIICTQTKLSKQKKQFSVGLLDVWLAHWTDMSPHSIVDLQW